MGLIENLQSLITAANGTTGKADADLTAATQSLIDGFGGGGGITLPGVKRISVSSFQAANATTSSVQLQDTEGMIGFLFYTDSDTAGTLGAVMAGAGFNAIPYTEKNVTVGGAGEYTQSGGQTGIEWDYAVAASYAGGKIDKLKLLDYSGFSAYFAAGRTYTLVQLY